MKKTLVLFILVLAVIGTIAYFAMAQDDGDAIPCHEIEIAEVEQ